jgi:hypothetical protein
VFESKMSLDVVGNRLLYHVESVHRATLDALEQQVGDAVRVVAFITVEGEAELPPMTQPGDVELVTEATRNNLRMNALGTFEVKCDPGLRCVYLQNDRKKLQSQRSLAALGSYQDTGANHEQSELGLSR